ncbi:LPP20 family lipoprotein [Marinomonas flavescens]|uniref:LPP20 family lipoprotein n=1 Tax=Marinomonas flavescens TaxID=2529379 RepID=UPI0010568162|nr:LPP20 family lipoprotein [Marinomonas flavescens]
MKLINIAFVAASVAVLAGCSSTPSTFANCSYPDSPGTAAPAWICSQPFEGLELQAVGFSKKMASGPGVMRDVAGSEARSRLVSAFSSDVNSRLSRVTKDSTVDSKNTNSDVTERVQKTLATMTLQRARVYRTQFSPEGNLYVLVGLNKEAYKANVDSVAKTAIGQDSPELYQKFLAKEADSSLDDVQKKIN